MTRTSPHAVVAVCALALCACAEQTPDAGDFAQDTAATDSGQVTDSGSSSSSGSSSGGADSSSTDAGPPDTGSDGADSSSTDAGPPDTGPIDSGPIDSGPIDSGPIDSGPIDSGPIDSGPIDSGPVDSGPVDSGPVDAGAPDLGPSDTFVDACLPKGKCDDKNKCTVDICNPSDGSCSNKPIAGTCDDGDACTTVDFCEGGKCIGKATKVYTKAFATTGEADGAAIAHGHGQFVVAGQSGGYPTAHGIVDNATQTWKHTYTTTTGRYMAALPIAGDGFLLAGWRKKSIGGSEMLFVHIGKSGAQQGWGKYTPLDTYAEARGLMPTQSGSQVVFTGYSKSGFNTWRTWLGVWDVKTHTVKDKIKPFGDISNHKFGPAIAEVGSRWVIAGWLRKKGGDRSGWLRSMDASTMANAMDHTFSTNKEGGFDAVAVMHDKGLLLGGWTSDTKYGGTDAWLVRTTSAFKQAWSVKLGTDGADQIYGLVPYGAGSVAVGYTYKKTGTDARATLWRLDPYGNTWWQRSYTTTGNRELRSVLPNGTAGVLIGGFQSSAPNGLIAMRTDAFGHPTCAASGVCVTKTEKSCSDGKACTGDSCKPASGCAYSKVPNGKKCGASKTCQANGDCS